MMLWSVVAPVIVAPVLLFLCAEMAACCDAGLCCRVAFFLAFYLLTGAELGHYSLLYNFEFLQETGMTLFSFSRASLQQNSCFRVFIRRGDWTALRP